MEHQPHNPNAWDDVPDHEAKPPTGPPDEAPFGGSALDKVSHYLRGAFAEADIRGEAISRDDAQAIATLLAALLAPDSAMGRFADTGDIDPPRLREECAHLKERTWQTPDVDTWIQRFGHFLTTQASAGRSAQSASAKARVDDLKQQSARCGTPSKTTGGSVNLSNNEVRDE